MGFGLEEDQPHPHHTLREAGIGQQRELQVPSAREEGMVGTRKTKLKSGPHTEQCPHHQGDNLQRAAPCETRHVTIVEMGPVLGTLFWESGAGR